MLVALAIANFYLLVYFSSEEDKNTAIFPKIVVVFCLTLTAASVLMLPMDVANARTNGGIPMAVLWQVIYITMAVMGVVVIPFAIFYYEAEDPDESSTKQLREAVKASLIALLVFTVLTAILYITLGVAEVPVKKMTSPLRELSDFSACSQCTFKDDKVTYRVSIPLYIISMASFLGMFLFVVFGGIGLAALPMDLLWAWHTRPKRISPVEYADKKTEIGRKATDFIAEGSKMKEKFKTKGGMPSSRREKAKFREYRTAVYLLEEEYLKLEKAYNGGLGPHILAIMWAWIQFVLGLISIVLTFLWLIHIIIYIVIRPPADGFLNNFFIALDEVWGLFGTLFFGIFAFYLLWAVIKGNFKMGVRVPLIFDLHPMKVGGTTMNSFLVNTLTVMLASLAVVQLCTSAFSQYNRFTGIDSIFNVGMRNLQFFKWFWGYYYWGLYVFAILTLIVLLAFPGKKRKSAIEDL